MKNFYENANALAVSGYEIYFTRSADDLLSAMSGVKKELGELLGEFYVPEEDIIKDGGGLSVINKALIEIMDDREWIDEKKKEAYSNEPGMDQYRSFANGRVGLNILWNTKDLSFDRYLENFRKLHQFGKLELGIIITRGQSLQTELQKVYERFMTALDPFTLGSLLTYITLSDKDKRVIEEKMQLRPRKKAIEASAKKLRTSKFGSTTTHMSKLFPRLEKGLGDPCPLILIGIGKERLVV